MIDDEVLLKALQNTLKSSDFPILGQKIKGKVRDCYVKDGKRILISSDRLSAFDVVLSSIPFKGQLLNDLTSYWFEKTKHIIPNHIIKRPHPNVFISHELDILPFEVIVREYLSGSSWRDYSNGKNVSGIELPKGLKKSEKLPFPIITPSTKAESGSHDTPISRDEIISSGKISEDLWWKVEDAAIKLFNFASELVAKNGLILFDTKFEFGLKTLEDGTKELYLADEIFTQDCSRYAIRTTYEDRMAKGEDPEMLDKEFIRAWLMERGYMGEGSPPEFPDSFRAEVAKRYILAYEMITGEKFVPNLKHLDPKMLLNEI